MEIIDAHTDIEPFLKLKVDLIKYHGSFAEDMGFIDNVVKEYNRETALKSFNLVNRKSYLLYDYYTLIGMLDFEITNIETDNSSSVFIHGLYIKPEYRHKGYILEVLKWIKENYKPDYLECDCYYNLASNDIVQHLGFKRLYTRYALNTKK